MMAQVISFYLKFRVTVFIVTTLRNLNLRARSRFYPIKFNHQRAFICQEARFITIFSLNFAINLNLKSNGICSTELMHTSPNFGPKCTGLAQEYCPFISNF